MISEIITPVPEDFILILTTPFSSHEPLTSSCVWTVSTLVVGAEQKRLEVELLHEIGVHMPLLLRSAVAERSRADNCRQEHT